MVLLENVQLSHRLRNVCDTLSGAWLSKTTSEISVKLSYMVRCIGLALYLEQKLSIWTDKVLR